MVDLRNFPKASVLVAHIYKFSFIPNKLKIA